MPITPSLRHCSNKYKLAREGEKDKEKDEDLKKWICFIYYYFCLWWSQVELKEMSFQLLLEDWQGSSSPDGGGKIIPPARNGERECSGEWFWASLWWYHEVYTMPSKNYSVWIKKNRIRFDFLCLHTRSKHFDSKGWWIRKDRKNAKEHFGLSVQRP